MSVPFRKRLQRYLGVNVENMFCQIPAFRLALKKGVNCLPASAFPSSLSKSKSIFGIAASDEVTPIAVATDLTKFIAPISFKIISISASLSIPQTSGTTFTIDVKANGTTILSTPITIDNGANSSISAAVLPVLSNVDILADTNLSIDVTQIGDGTAAGLKLYLVVEI